MILTDGKFATVEKNKLPAIKLLTKNREKLTKTTSIKFNEGHIKKTNNNDLYFNQSRQCSCLRLVTIKSANLTNTRGVVRSNVTPKDQYVAQRARDVYIAIMTQSKISFDFSFVAQAINFKEENVKQLNKRLQWQMENLDRDLRFVQLNTFSFRLFIFRDTSFANNENLFSQIEFVIVLVDKFNKINLIHWLFIKYKRVTRSVLASELYAMAHEFDFEAVIKSTIDLILNTFIFMIICIDSKSLYDCLMKLKNTQKKRFMIDVMCLRQSYKRREIMKIKWIDENSNSADAMIKIKSCSILKNLIDTNTINLNAAGWVEQEKNPDTGP